MGHHYVPRQHLRRFAIDGVDSHVWMYDKQTGIFRRAAIANVAQEKAYYDTEIEKALSEVVEGPGKIAIDKLLNRKAIDNAERSTLSLYFMLMLTRGPRQRKKSLRIVPEVLATTVARMEADIQKWISEEPGNPKARQRLKELEEASTTFAAEIPQSVLDQIRRPFWSERTVECIHNMHWHIFPAPPGLYFVTCDTPAHTHESYGVGTRDSEFTITLSRDFALIGEHKKSWGIRYEQPRAQIAKEINRRILSHAERFVFSPTNAKWIETVANKNAPHLNRIDFK